MQLPSGPTGLVRARPSGPLSPVPAPLLGSQAWDTWGLCAHRAQRSAVHPGELLPLRPPGLPRPPPSTLCSPLSALASCLSESPSPPGQGPATWHRTQGFPGGEQDGRPGRRWEPGVSEGEGCCSGACVPAEGCSAPTLVPLLTPTPRRSSFPAPLSPGSPAPGPCFVVPEAAAAPRPPHLIPQDPRTPRLLPSPLMLPDAGKKHFLIASWAPGWAGMRLRDLASPPGPELGPQGRPGCWEWAAVDEPADPGWAGEGHTPRVPRLAGGGTCLPDAVSLCQLTCYGCGLAGLASGFLGLGDPLAAPLRTSW